jgi:cyclophilin family peptidyl-prolyl cis-trans isomerase
VRAYDANCAAPREIWTSNIHNLTKGVGLERVETLTTAKGIPLPAAANYEVEVTYNNTSGTKQDAMAMMGMFMTAPEWEAPAWSRTVQRTALFPDSGESPASKTAAAKGASNAKADPAVNALFNKLPLFSGAASVADKPYLVDMETTAGTLRFRVVPAWAPKTAAALKQIFAHNLYIGLAFRAVGDGFALQVPEVRPNGLPNEDDRLLLRRLPAEFNPNATHRAGRLSMSMWLGHENSATSSFSFIARDAPHLDGKYTVFAETSDEGSKRLLEALAARAAKGEVIRVVKTAVVDENDTR